VFLFPWALNIEALGGFAIAEMFVFIAVLMLGWLYALKKGALKWQ
jgi:NADH-quinone oxidoreductase subunit A